MQPIVKGLAHIGIIVSNMETSVDFYKRLGFTLDREVKMSGRLAFLSAGTCLIELIERVGGEKRADGPVDHVAMEVADVLEAVRQTKANGIEIDDSSLAAKSPEDIFNFFFEGPDGERLEFFTELK